MLTNREQYIKSLFIPANKKEGVEYMSDDDADIIVKRISEIGNRIGFIGINISQDQKKVEQRKHKYDVWIAKEAKKNIDILDRSIDIRLIIDWAYENRIDLFSHTFESAYNAQADWHMSLLHQKGIELMEVPKIDNSRIVFRFNDNKHFLYLLKEDELAYEGKKMGHCVGNYKARVRNFQSLIISLRDQNNEPHVTIEIQPSLSMVVQQQGKGNQRPAEKYINLLKEFILYASNYKGLKDAEMIKLMNPWIN